MQNYPSKALWILHGTLITQNENRDVLPAHLEIREGKIHAFHPWETPVPSDVETLDATGLTLTPGFIQPHIHLCQTLFRNMADDLELLDWLSQRIWPYEAAHNPESMYLSAQLGIHELLCSGTTTLLDMASIRHTDAIFRAVKDSGIRANIGKCLMDHPETCPTYLIESTEDALQEARSLLEQWHGAENDRIRVSLAPRFVVSCTEPLLKQVGALSEEFGAIIHTHSSENQKEVELVRELVGQENAAYLHDIGLMSERLVLAHCIWLNEAETAHIKETGTHVVHCPSSNMKLASGFAKVPEMLAQGINVALAADGAPCNNTLNAFQEMRLAGLIHKPRCGPRSMPAQQVLDMATRNGAKAMGWFDTIGSLEVGKAADIAAIDLRQVSNLAPYTETINKEALVSAIVYASSPQQVQWTLVNGHVVAKSGQVTGIPRKDISAEHVHQVQQALLQRVKEFVS